MYDEVMEPTPSVGLFPSSVEEPLPQNVEYVLSTPRKLDRRRIPRRSSAPSSVVPLKEFVPQNRGDCSVGRFRLLNVGRPESPNRVLARGVISRPRGPTSTSPPNLIDEPLGLQRAMGTDPSWIYPATIGPRRISSTASMDRTKRRFLQRYVFQSAMRLSRPHEI